MSFKLFVKNLEIDQHQHQFVFGVFSGALLYLSQYFQGLKFYSSVALFFNAFCGTIINLNKALNSRSTVNSHWLSLAKNIAICAFICMGNLPMACAIVVGDIATPLLDNIRAIVHGLINKKYEQPTNQEQNLHTLLSSLIMVGALISIAPTFALGTGLWVAGVSALTQPIVFQCLSEIKEGFLSLFSSKKQPPTAVSQTKKSQLDTIIEAEQSECNILAYVYGFFGFSNKKPAHMTEEQKDLTRKELLSV